MKQVRRWLPIAISIALLGLLAAYAPWRDVIRILSHFKLIYIAILLALSLLYYVMKTVRFQRILLAMGIEQPFDRVAVSYMSAQPVSLLPAGEIFRSHSLRRYTGVPVHKSIGQFTLQGFFEGAAMAVLVLFSAFALGTLRVIAIILSITVLTVLWAIRRGYLTWAGKLLNRLPYVHVSEKRIEQFSRRNRRVLTSEWLPHLLVLSILIELVGAAVAFTSVRAIGGHINGYEAILVYVLPIIAGFISFLPGGFGVSEQSAVGILLIADMNIAQAVAATLIMRFTIVGMGVAYGTVTALFGSLAIPPAKELSPEPK